MALSRWIHMLLAAVLMAAVVPAQPPVVGMAGVGVTPANFPKHGSEEVREMFRQAREAGPVGVFIYQWSEDGFLSVARRMLDMAAKANLTPMVGLSPTVLAGARDQLDVPARVRRAAAGRKLSFLDKTVHLPFIADALELARLKPAYLCLATEINFLAFKDIREYVAFAHVYKKLYHEAKKISPETKIFVTFQWDYFPVMRRREPERVKEHAKLIEIFMPELDVIGLTSYPASHFRSPAEIPADYYSRVFDYVKRDRPVVYMEIGWPSMGVGGEASQAAFVQRLPKLMSEVGPQVTAWSLLHDVNHQELSQDLTSTGLLTGQGKPKPAMKLWKGLAGK